MASWLATGPPVMVCCAPLSVVTTWSCRWKFWIAPPAISTIAAMIEIGSRMRSGSANQIHPEVADFVRPAARESANQGDRDGDSHCGGDEVLHGQPGHLHQVALGCLARVGLPVGVGDEADRGVPGQRRRHRGRRIVQVQRQLVLQQLEEEQEQDADRRECQHASRVGVPRLLSFGVGADDAVDGLLDPPVLLARCRRGYM